MAEDIIDVLESSVALAVRERAEKLRINGRVEIRRESPTAVSAFITDDNRKYRTGLSWGNDFLTQNCTCTNRSGNICAHAMALALEAYDCGYLDTLQPRHVNPTQEDVVNIVRKEFSNHGPRPDVLAFIDGSSGVVRPIAPRTVDWKEPFRGMASAAERYSYNAPRPALAPDEQLVYSIIVDETMKGKGVVVRVGSRRPKKNGAWSAIKAASIANEQLELLPDVADRKLLVMLQSSKDAADTYYGYYDRGVKTHCILRAALQEDIIREMCGTGRCRIVLDDDDADGPFISWDDGPAWRFVVSGQRDDAAKAYYLRAVFRRDQEEIAVDKPLMVCAGGILFTERSAARLQDGDIFQWIALFRAAGELRIPFKQAGDFLKTIAGLPVWPELQLPEGLRLEEVHATPLPKITLAKHPYGYENRTVVNLAFDYGGTLIAAHQPERGVLLIDERKLLVRDPARETAARDLLLKQKCRPRGKYGAEAHQLELPAKAVPNLVRSAAAAGFRVEAEGKFYRNAGQFDFAVTSGIDWFDLEASLDFEGQKVALPELLAAVRRGDATVVLADGSLGIVPEAALKKYAVFAGMGQTVDGALRFSRAQAGLLDALLAAQPQARCDPGFSHVRTQLREFKGVYPLDPSATFRGQLRPYQRDALGWFEFLRSFGFGGCLADDMGLGKTVQVLALLERRRLERLEPSAGSAGESAKAPGASLVVAPRSLVFNWKQEAARFTPNLRVLDHTGHTRSKTTGHFEQYDMVLTTYGTLRRDAPFFKDAQFDYVILDEAQAIKNSNTESAKAARLLHGGHRLALSGTPVENHLRELWSLFEFLNPGMLGSAAIFQNHISATNGESLNLLAHALRPFILRRTKEQVATELPVCTEQTLFCELPEAQRAKYDQLRDYYRQSLLRAVETEGMGRAKIQILEALLRLRQAACHPGLLDKQLVMEPSAKFDMLLEQIADVISEGHKALVFSQFTSLLAILKKHLANRLVDGEKLSYAYLDGKTRDRQTVVDQFQNNPDCKLFLISLKAGGLGLNLTSADYVFLLDPWWNPAVESQAIDRAHRIGQQRPVFAYRLIAKDTVEEKVLQLQQTKRDLADAIIGENNSLISNLSREDLQLLLS